MRNLLIPILLFALTPLPALAQDLRPGKMSEDEIEAKRRLMKELGDGDDVDEALKEKEAESRALLSRFMKAVGSARPRRVAPGASGEVKIALLIKEGAAVAADAEFNLTAADESQGPFVFGEAVISEPRPGESQGMRGRMCYEDNVTFTIPFSVRGGAEYRIYLARFMVNADVSDAHSGRAFSVTQEMGVTVQIEVGDPLPLVQGRGRGELVRPEAAIGDAPEEARAPNSRAAPIEPDGDRVESRRPDRIAPGTAGPESEDGIPEDPTREEGGLPISLLAGAGVVAAVLILLLLGKR